MTAVAVVALVACVAVGGARWLRVSQREHYLPGQVVRTAARWLACRPPNAVVLAAAGGAIVAALALSVGGASAPAVLVALVAAATGTAFPVGMSIRGEVPLKFTARARRQAALAIVVVAVASVVVALVAGVAGALALAPLVTLAGVDAAAFLARPIERRLARRFRRQAVARLGQVGPRVVAVTGSYGKTTVKNHIRDLVAPAFSVVASPASWNNEAGLSRTVNEHLAPGTDVLVAEMGTYGPGEIAALVDWLHPEVSVISAIGPVHLERMRTLETIARAKAEVLTGARVAVLCVDDPLLAELAESVGSSGAPGELWRVGTDARPGLDVRVTRAVTADAGDPTELVVEVHGEELGRLPAGRVHARNVGCAVAVALALGVPRPVVQRSLAALAPATSRADAAVSDGKTVIDDTFNSNPAGAAAAVEKLSALVPGGRRVVVTPGMVEMGPLQDEVNREFAATVAKAGDDLVVVGWTNRRALAAGHPSPVTVGDRAAALAWVRANTVAGDGILWENDLPDHYP